MLTTELPFSARDYQRDAALAFIGVAARKRAAGSRAAALTVFPTGGGKTRLAYLVSLSLGLRVLFLTHTDALVDQVEREVRRLFPAMRIGVIKGARNDLDAEFTIASVRTLERAGRLAAAMDAWTIKPGVAPEIIIVDEAHHAVDGSGYHRIAQGLPRAHILGLTATPERMDRKPLGDVFPDGVSYRLSVDHAVDPPPGRERGPGGAGWLVPVTDGEGGHQRSRRVVVEGLDAWVARACDRGGDPLAGNNAEAVRRNLTAADRARLLEAVVSATTNSVVESVGRFKRKVVAFTLNVECSRLIAARARARGVVAAHVHGAMTPAELAQLSRDVGLPLESIGDVLLAHREGKLQALVNCQVLLEGYDDPTIDGVVWGRPTLSRSLWCQGVGRGMRPDPDRPARLADGSPNPAGKRDLLVHDLVGAQEVHGLQTAELIFREEVPVEPEADADALEEQLGGGDTAADREKSMLANFVRLCSGRARPSATRGPRVAWLEVAQGECYAIGGSSDGCVYVVERAGDGWVAFREPDRAHRGDPSVRLTGVLPELEARAMAEDAARAGESFDARDALWRSRRVNEKMRSAMTALRVRFAPDTTMGDASDAITVAVAKLQRRSRAERGIVSAGAALLD